MTERCPVCSGSGRITLPLYYQSAENYNSAGFELDDRPTRETFSCPKCFGTPTPQNIHVLICERQLAKDPFILAAKMIEVEKLRAVEGIAHELYSRGFIRFEIRERERTLEGRLTLLDRDKAETFDNVVKALARRMLKKTMDRWV